MADAVAGADAPPLHLLAVANPDRQARARIREVFRKRLDHNTRVLTFDSFEELARFVDVQP
jgi:hypothetical protein